MLHIDRALLRRTSRFQFGGPSNIFTQIYLPYLWHFATLALTVCIAWSLQGSLCVHRKMMNDCFWIWFVFIDCIDPILKSFRWNKNRWSYSKHVFEANKDVPYMYDMQRSFIHSGGTTCKLHSTRNILFSTNTPLALVMAWSRWPMRVRMGAHQ